jgi:photosystem II stability/assembly factor-like uncharacterized protein
MGNFGGEIPLNKTGDIMIRRTLTIFFMLTAGLTAQWVDQTGNLPVATFTGHAMAAVDSHTAVAAVWISGQGAALFKTVDGGESWVEIPLPNDPGQPYDLTLVGDRALWVCTGNPGKILFTADDGVTWVEQYHDSTVTDFFNYIEMFDADHGVAMGDAVGGGSGPAIILNTSDGGTTWTSVNDSAFGGWSGDLWRRIDFVSPTVGYFFPSGSSPQLLYKTVDGGATWHPTNHHANYLQVLRFFNAEIGFTASGGTLYRTQDGGVMWDSLAAPADVWAMDIEFAPEDSTKLWFASGNDVYYSADLGLTWEYQLTTGGVRDMVFTDSLHGWVLSDGGLFHTTTGGQLNVVNDDQVTPHRFKLYPNYPNPFNSITTFRYYLNREALIEVAIYDLLGHKLTTLVSGEQLPGYRWVNWDGRNSKGNMVSTGIYLCVLSSGDMHIARKFLFLK